VDQKNVTEGLGTALGELVAGGFDERFDGSGILAVFDGGLDDGKEPVGQAGEDGNRLGDDLFSGALGVAQEDGNVLAAIFAFGTDTGNKHGYG